MNWIKVNSESEFPKDGTPFLCLNGRELYIGAWVTDEESRLPSFSFIDLYSISIPDEDALVVDVIMEDGTTRKRAPWEIAMKLGNSGYVPKQVPPYNAVLKWSHYMLLPELPDGL